MHSNEITERKIDIWDILSETPLFAQIFKMQALTATLSVALRTPEFSESEQSHMAAVADLLHHDSKQLTDAIAGYLATKGILPTQLE